MREALFMALIIASPIPVSAATECPRVLRISPVLDKPQRSITSPSDPLFGHLIGRSRAEVIECQGEPSTKKPNAWTCYEPLGPSAQSFRHSWTVKFRRGKVVEVDVRRKAVGCILIPPVREGRDHRIHPRGVSISAGNRNAPTPQSGNFCTKQWRSVYNLPSLRNARTSSPPSQSKAGNFTLIPSA